MKTALLAAVLWLLFAVPVSARTLRLSESDRNAVFLDTGTLVVSNHGLPEREKGTSLYLLRTPFAFTRDGDFVFTHMGSTFRLSGSNAAPFFAETNYAYRWPKEIALSPDGTLYLATYNAFSRRGPDGVFTALTNLTAWRMGVSPDGTFYLQCEAGLLKLEKDGKTLSLIAENLENPQKNREAFFAKLHPDWFGFAATASEAARDFLRKRDVSACAESGTNAFYAVIGNALFRLEKDGKNTEIADFGRVREDGLMVIGLGADGFGNIYLRYDIATK